MSEITVSEPITEELRNLEDWKRVTQCAMRDGEPVEYVTLEFHEAFMAEMRARWRRDTQMLEEIDQILTDAKEGRR